MNTHPIYPPEPAFLPTAEPAPDNIPICGQTMTLAQFVPKRWPTDRITWHVDPSGETDLTAEQIRQAFRDAFAEYARFLELEFVEVPNARDAMISAKFGRIDRPGNTLAMSHVADGTLRQKEQTYDTSERWVVSLRPTGNVIDLGRVIKHEVGHAMGLLHFAPGTGALLDPTYSLRVAGLTPRDIAALEQIGYKRRTAPPAPPVPPPTGGHGDGQIVIDVDRETIRLPAGWTVSHATAAPTEWGDDPIQSGRTDRT
jgi:hypothetical protein